MRYFDLRGAPGKFHAGFYAVLGEVVFRNVHDFGGDNFSIQVSRFLNGGVFRDRQDPADACQPLLCVDQLRQFVHGRTSFHHPVVTGDPRVQHARLDVTRHLLRAHQETLDFRVVNRWNVTSRAQRDLPASTRKKIERRVLQAAFGDSQLQPTH